MKSSINSLVFTGARLMDLKYYQRPFPTKITSQQILHETVFEQIHSHKMSPSLCIHVLTVKRFFILSYS